MCDPFLLVLCPASLSRVEKKSGETCIQFWFYAPRSGMANHIAEQCLHHGLYLKKIVMLT